MIILPSLHPVSAQLLTQRIHEIEGLVDIVHLDLADGSSTGHITKQTEEELDLLFTKGYKVELHLMSLYPLKYLTELQDRSWYRVNFSLKVKENIRSILDYLSESNIEAGLIVRSDDNLEDLVPYLDSIKVVQLMGKNPGDNKLGLSDNSLQVIPELLNIISKYAIKLELDGGVLPKNIKLLKDLGVDICISGRGHLFKNDRVAENLELLLRDIN